MSTRYVWEKYYPKYVKEQEEVLSATLLGTNYNNGQITNYYTYGKLGRIYSVAESDSPNMFEITAVPYNILSGNQNGLNSDYNAIPYTNATVGQKISEYYFPPPSLLGYWFLSPYTSGGSSYGTLQFSTSSNSSDPKMSFYRAYSALSKTNHGELINILSSASSSTYPSNGTSTISNETYWYIYLGSDSVDPVSVSYSTKEIKPGGSINVTVSPSTSNKYGATISYQYQYSINGGSTWTNSGSVTTATSKSITIPTSAKQFQVRVRAQDNLGFISTTYVTGANIATQTLNLWVGVNGKARKGTDMWIGVNGKARKAVEAYIGVNGKARRFL